MPRKSTKKSVRRRVAAKEIVHVLSTSSDLYALTEDGGIYRSVENSDGDYGWDELPAITDESIFNLEDDDDEEEEEEEDE